MHPSLVAKLISMAAMFAITLVCGLIPIVLVNFLKNRMTKPDARSKMDNILSMLNCFVGGVFIGTTLLHLLPEAREATDKFLVVLGVPDPKFPVAEFDVCIGFFIVMFLEHLVMQLQHNTSHNKVPYEKLQEEGSAAEKKQVVHDTTRSRNASYGSIDIPPLTDTDKPAVLSISVAVEGDQGKLDKENSYGNMSRTHSHHSHDRHSHQHHEHAHEHLQVAEAGARNSRSPSVIADGTCVHVIHPGHHEHHHFGDSEQLGSIRSFMLLLALSLHTLFEGMAIGLQGTAPAVWSLFSAIIIHKSIIAFSLGFQFSENLRHVGRAFVFVAMFAIMSPIGISIGTALTESSSGTGATMDVVNGILQGISTGTLIYVAFFEVLFKEVGADHSVLKVFFIIVGFTLMALINMFTHEEE